MAVEIKKKSEQEKKTDLVESILKESGVTTELVKINGVNVGLACCANDEDRKALEDTISAIAEVAKTPAEVQTLLMNAALESEKKAKAAEARKKKAEEEKKKEQDITELLKALLGKLG